MISIRLILLTLITDAQVQCQLSDRCGSSLRPGSVCERQSDECVSLQLFARLEARRCLKDIEPRLFPEDGGPDHGD